MTFIVAVIAIGVAITAIGYVLTRYGDKHR
jgi:hypothetical protein